MQAIAGRWTPRLQRLGCAPLKCLAIKEGDKLPANVIFKTRVNNQWKDVASNDIFKGKRVAVFGLPVTPTCSSTHLPRYSELANELISSGLDDITVNDAYVCNAWLKDLDVDNIKVLPDGNTEFTKSIGALVDKSDTGFGMRSWRYSMIIDDGQVEKVFCEPDKKGDPLEVSDADTMLKYLKGAGK